MKKTFFKLCYVLIPLILLCFLSVTTFAGEMLEGQVIADDDLNLINIRVEIRTYTEGENGWYHGSLAQTLYTDASGKFSFERPEGHHFTCQIETAALPSGYGAEEFYIDSESQYYKKNGLLFKITPVESVKAEFIGYLRADLYGKNGQSLFRDTEIINESIGKYEHISYRELKELGTVIYNGKVLVGIRQIDFSTEDDISNKSVWEKLSYLYDKEFISKDKYYDLWLDHRDDDFEGSTIYICGGGDPIKFMEEELRIYASQTSNSKLKSRIQSSFGISTEEVETEQFPISSPVSSDETKTDANTTFAPIASDMPSSEKESESNDIGVIKILIPVFFCIAFFALGLLIGKKSKK